MALHFVPLLNILQLPLLLPACLSVQPTSQPATRPDHHHHYDQLKGVRQARVSEQTKKNKAHWVSYSHTFVRSSLSRAAAAVATTTTVGKMHMVRCFVTRGRRRWRCGGGAHPVGRCEVHYFARGNATWMPILFKTDRHRQPGWRVLWTVEYRE